MHPKFLCKKNYLEKTNIQYNAKLLKHLSPEELLKCLLNSFLRTYSPYFIFVGIVHCI